MRHEGWGKFQGSPRSLLKRKISAHAAENRRKGIVPTMPKVRCLDVVADERAPDEDHGDDKRERDQDAGLLDEHADKGDHGGSSG